MMRPLPPSEAAQNDALRLQERTKRRSRLDYLNMPPQGLSARLTGKLHAKHEDMHMQRWLLHVSLALPQYGIRDFGQNMGSPSIVNVYAWGRARRVLKHSRKNDLIQIEEAFWVSMPIEVLSGFVIRRSCSNLTAWRKERFRKGKPKYQQHARERGQEAYDSALLAQEDIPEEWIDE